MFGQNNSDAEKILNNAATKEEETSSRGRSKQKFFSNEMRYLCGIALSAVFLDLESQGLSEQTE